MSLQAHTLLHGFNLQFSVVVLCFQFHDATLLRVLLAHVHSTCAAAASTRTLISKSISIFGVIVVVAHCILMLLLLARLRRGEGGGGGHARLGHVLRELDRFLAATAHINETAGC